MKPRGAWSHPVVIALSSCLAGCASLLGIDDDVCRLNTSCTQAVLPNIPDATTPDATVPDAGPHEHPPPSGTSTPAPQDASAADAEVADAAPKSACDRYCDAITTRCTGESADYKSVPEDPVGFDECQALCPHFIPTSSVTRNTLECRLEIVEGRIAEASECHAAGRGGYGTCGSTCDSYCQLMQSICPASYAAITATESCETICAGLTKRASYDAVAAETDNGSVECRLWHLGRAAITGVPDNARLMDGNMHCLHAAGRAPCGDTALDANGGAL